MSEHEIMLTVADDGEAYVRCATCHLGLYIVVAGNERPLEDMLETVSRHLRLPAREAEPRRMTVCHCDGPPHVYEPDWCRTYTGRPGRS